MPPYVPRKRLRDTSTVKSTAKSSIDGKSATTAEPRKATLYDDLDASSAPQSFKQPSSIFQTIHGDDSDSSLTSLSDSEFEDVPQAKRAKLEGSDDDDVEFEDVEEPTGPLPDAPVTSGDLELTLIRDNRISLTNPFGEKKGPSKKERKIRNSTHCVHVLTLLWHNAVRNSWLCDPELQAIMLSHIPAKLWDYVDRWRRNSGLESTAKPPAKKGNSKAAPKTAPKALKRLQRESRDWGDDATKLEEGVVDMSHGDPLFRLIKTLMSWWKQRFKITAPGTRKWGYMSLERLDRIMKAYNAGGGDASDFGERFQDLDAFRAAAQSCQGSRDVGAQLFTALLRGLGLETRMVANLQCLGFGWSKFEEADPEKDNEKDNEKDDEKDLVGDLKTAQKPRTSKGKTSPEKSASKAPTRNIPSVKSDEDDLGLEYNDTDDESVVEIEVTPKKSIKPSLPKPDKDLEYPHYWTEVQSPITNKFLPVDPIVKSIVASNRDLVESFEPRGAKADKARQVIAYVVGYSSDGTAKDVTVRYLKRQVLPGRTKGVRMPLEKIPVYNKNGKVSRYEQFDWFKTAMSCYRRGGQKHPITEIDEMEDSTDLKPFQPEKKEVKDGEETLQYYKQSKEFVLARHLKREEALKPGANPVKVFKNKAKGGKVEDEDVFERSDVVNVKSAETWHKQGRAPLPGEEPLKRVPYRAATLNRRREILEAEAATGHKVLQGLYSFNQTDWIIPPPIENGIIPKNEYGNIDLFAEHMCPKGAVHVPFRGAIRVCKRLQIDYAEAVVDFEFGHRMAVPVIQGVVVAKEYHDQVMEELQKDEAEKARKEDEKRRKAALGKWRKFLMGLRIVQRIKLEYGHITDDVSVFSHGSTSKLAGVPDSAAGDEDMAGGFLPEGYEEEQDIEEQSNHQSSSFFPAIGEDDDGAGDDLIMEDDRNEANVSEVLEDTTMAEDVMAEEKALKPARRKQPVREGARRSRRLIVEDVDEDGDLDEHDE